MIIILAISFIILIFLGIPIALSLGIAFGLRYLLMEDIL